MATKDYKENDFKPADLNHPENIKIGIVVSEWHSSITENLLNGSKEVLSKFNICEDNITIIKVPGSFELTMGARILLSSMKLDAVICLGCVVKGETNHDDYINQAVATGITNLGLSSGKPVIFGLLTVLNQQQAEDRAGGKYGNKGSECALTALQMIGIRQQFSESKSKIGFS